MTIILTNPYNEIKLIKTLLCQGTSNCEMVENYFITICFFNKIINVDKNQLFNRCNQFDLV